MSENPGVSQGLSWEGIKHAFSEDVLNLWIPLTNLSHQLDVTLFGLNADLHHISALFYHLLAATSLFWFLAKCLQTGARMAIIVTLLFVLHPIQVESWAWISQRKDTLSALFAFLSLGLWIRYLSSGSIGLLIACLAALALGLLSKPVLVILPVLFWVAAVTFPAGDLQRRRIYLPIAVSFAMAGVVALLTLHLQALRPEASAMGSIDLLTRACLGLANYWRYFGRLILPVDLHYFTPLPQQLPIFQAALGIVFLATLSFLAWQNRRKTPLIPFAVSLFVIPLVPTVGFITSGEAFEPDRYAYIASVGLFLLVALAFNRLRLPRNLAWGVVVALFIILALTSYRQALTWRTMDTLTSHSLSIVPDNYKAHAHRAEWLLTKGEAREALVHWQAAYAARPDHDRAAIELGRAALQKKDHQTSLELFSTHQRYWPGNAASLEGLGVSLAALGRLREAEEIFEELLQKDPGNARHRRTLERLRDSR